jgi:hypothetical protein
MKNGQSLGYISTNQLQIRILYLSYVLSKLITKYLGAKLNIHPNYIKVELNQWR